jgi:hypothetical protein
LATIDPANEAREIAETFASMSRTVDAYMEDHFAELTQDQLDFFNGVIRQLDDTHDRLIAMAIQETLDALKDDLGEIAGITRKAEQALKHLNTIAKITKIAAAVAELGADITTADYGAIPSALTDLAEALPGQA